MCNLTYLSPKVWPAQAPVEADIVVAIYEAYSEGGRDQVLYRTLHARDDIFAIDDRVDMLSNGCISSNTIFIHDTDEIRLRKKGRFARSTFPKFAD